MSNKWGADQKLIDNTLEMMARYFDCEEDEFYGQTLQSLLIDYEMHSGNKVKWGRFTTHDLEWIISQ